MMNMSDNILAGVVKKIKCTAKLEVDRCIPEKIGMTDKVTLPRSRQIYFLSSDRICYILLDTRSRCDRKYSSTKLAVSTDPIITSQIGNFYLSKLDQ